jgi:hypothetical protein
MTFEIVQMYIGFRTIAILLSLSSDCDTILLVSAISQIAPQSFSSGASTPVAELKDCAQSGLRGTERLQCWPAGGKSNPASSAIFQARR